VPFSPDLLNKEDTRPLTIAVVSGQEAMVQLLVARGAAINGADPHNNCSALHYCAMLNRPRMAKILLHNKANVNLLGGLPSSTPLDLASELGHYETMAVLFVNSPPTLQFANLFPWKQSLELNSRNAHLNLVRFFRLENGANVNIRRGLDGKTALHNACRRPVPLKSVQTLLDHGADVNITDNDGNTPLHCAVAWHHPADVLLVQKGANVDAKNKDGYTPLDFTACIHVAMSQLRGALSKGTLYEPSSYRLHDAQSKSWDLVRRDIDFWRWQRSDD